MRERALHAIELGMKGLTHPENIASLRETLCPLLEECMTRSDIASARALQSCMVHHSLHSISIFSGHLIRLFSTCGTLLEANVVFCMVAKPTVHTWHAIVATYAMFGKIEMALHLLYRMQLDNVKPDRITFLCVLKACASSGDLWHGGVVHELIILFGIDMDVVIGSTLIDMYSKFGTLTDAHKVLSCLPGRNVVSWNALLTGYVSHEQLLPAFQLLKEMQRDGIIPNEVTYSAILKVCGKKGTLYQGKLIHCQVIECGFYTDSIVSSALVDMYAKCGQFEEAHTIFDKMKVHSIVAWNSLISGSVQYCKGHSTLALFERMQAEGVKPDCITLSCIVRAWGSTGDLLQGMLMHAKIIELGFDQDDVIENTLLDMYGQCGTMDEAFKVFNRLANRDLVSWTTMISRCIQHGSCFLALNLFEEMQLDGILPSSSLVLTVLKDNSSIEHTQVVHNYVFKCGIEADVFIGSALIDAYAKCSSLDEANFVFNSMQRRDIALWNAIIAGYAQNDCNTSALALYLQMELDGLKADKTTYSTVIRACGSIGAIGQGQFLHDLIIRLEVVVDTILGNALVDMYAKCGAFEEARAVLKNLPSQDVASWGALIAGYAEHGRYHLAKACFEEMQKWGITPDDKTYTSMLAACSHAGKVEESKDYFSNMKAKHNITPSVEHFNCMVDLLASQGRLKEAHDLLEGMPIKEDITGWMTLLAACRRHGDVAIGQQCFDQVVHLDSRVAAAYVHISNIYTDANMWDDVKKSEELRYTLGVFKKPGIAWIEVDNKLQEFVVRQKRDTYKDIIFNQFNQLCLCMKEGGYMPHLDLVFEGHRRE